MLQQQLQKQREAAMQCESIETVNEKEREMVTIIRELFAEAARGNLKTHTVRLIHLRAYDNHCGEHNWLQTLTVFKRGLSIKVHLAKFSEFLKKGEQYAIFMKDRVGLISTMIDNITTDYTQLCNNCWGPTLLVNTLSIRRLRRRRKRSWHHHPLPMLPLTCPRKRITLGWTQEPGACADLT